MQQVEVQVFGVLRNHWPSGRVNVELSALSTGADLKRELIRLAGIGGAADKVAGILGTCALARSEGLIEESTVLGRLTGIAVLPPVCGG